MFDIVGTKSLDSNAVDFVEHGINFVGRTFENNGIQGKIKKQKFEPNEPFTITATVIGNYKYVKYQKEPYYCSQNINKLTPKPIFIKWSEKIAIFLMTNIWRFVSMYDGQQGGYKLDDIKNHKIKLPITASGEIDFEFMESFVAELEAERVAELEAYLAAASLKDYELTAAELSALSKFENYNWGEFRIGDLFEIKTPKKRFDANKIKFGGLYPYVVRTSTNNGIRGYITENIDFLNEKNTISFGQDTATMFYQKSEYFTGDKIKVFKLKDYELNSKIANFLISVMTKAFSNFSWGSSSFNVKILNEVKILLPLNKNGEIDFEFMNNFIKAIKKLVIKDVVLYTDNKIKATKSIVSSNQ